MIRGRVDRKAATATGYAWLVWEKRATGLPRRMWVPPCRRRVELCRQYGWLDEERSSWRMPHSPPMGAR